MKFTDRIYVAGHRGLVGSAIVRELHRRGFRSLVTRMRSEVDLTDARATEEFLRESRPDYVFLCAARVGGIEANRSLPADFIRENLQIQTNVIESAYQADVQRLLFLGSSCIYPRDTPQPIPETAIMTGPLEPTNSAYATAKLAGIEMLRAYRDQYGFRSVAVMPTNLYGPADNYALDSAHVLPALIRRFHEAKVSGVDHLTLWGTGNARREFLHVDDCARACVSLMADHRDDDIFNVGTGEDLSIFGLAATVASVVGYRGAVDWDPSKPDGTPAKRLDIRRLSALGWAPSITLEAGLRRTYHDYLTDPARLAEGT